MSALQLAGGDARDGQPLSALAACLTKFQVLVNVPVRGSPRSIASTGSRRRREVLEGRLNGAVEFSSVLGNGAAGARHGGGAGAGGDREDRPRAGGIIRQAIGQ